MNAVVESAEASGLYEEPIRIVAADDVRRFVRERGGRLYVWTVAHRNPRCVITLLETATTCPPGPTIGFVHFGPGDFDLFSTRAGAAGPTCWSSSSSGDEAWSEPTGTTAPT